MTPETDDLQPATKHEKRSQNPLIEQMKAYKLDLQKIRSTQNSILSLESVIQKLTNLNEIQTTTRVELLGQLAAYLQHTERKNPYDTQLVAALNLLEPTAIEMKTGEGKTLAIQLALLVRAIETKSTTGPKGNLLLTSNEALAQRDSEAIATLAAPLGLTVGRISYGKTQLFKDGEWTACAAAEAFSADISVGQPADLCHYILLDLDQTNVFHSRPGILQYIQHILIDEVDQWLLDGAATPYVISSSQEKISEKQIGEMKTVYKALTLLTPVQDFKIDPLSRQVLLTPAGSKKVWGYLLKEHPKLKSDVKLRENQDLLSAGHVTGGAKRSREFELAQTAIQNVGDDIGQNLNALSPVLSLESAELDEVVISQKKLNQSRQLLRVLAKSSGISLEELKLKDGAHLLPPKLVQAIRRTHFFWVDQQNNSENDEVYSEQMLGAYDNLSPDQEVEIRKVRGVLEALLTACSLRLGKDFQIITEKIQKPNEIELEDITKVVPLNPITARSEPSKQFTELLSLAIMVANNLLDDKANNPILETSSTLQTYLSLALGFRGGTLSGISGTPGQEKELEPYGIGEILELPGFLEWNAHNQGKDHPGRAQEEVLYFESDQEKFEKLAKMLLESVKEVSHESEDDVEEAPVDESEKESGGPPHLVLFRDDAELTRFLKHLKETDTITHLFPHLEILSDIDLQTNPQKEQEIISNAGKFGKITLTTYMLGRGTDIIPDDQSNKKGGLRVVLASVPSNSRVHEQLAGRTARQANPGEVTILLSKEDPRVASSSLFFELLLGEKLVVDELAPEKVYDRILARLDEEEFEIRKTLLEQASLEGRFLTLYATLFEEVQNTIEMRDEIKLRLLTKLSSLWKTFLVYAEHTKVVLGGEGVTALKSQTSNQAILQHRLNLGFGVLRYLFEKEKERVFQSEAEVKKGFTAADLKERKKQKHLPEQLLDRLFVSLNDKLQLTNEQGKQVNLHDWIDDQVNK